jgi:hypothetical protein
MNRIILSAVLVWAFILGFTMSKSTANAVMTRHSNSEIKGLLSDVRNPQGEYLGRTIDFVKDAKGQIIFAVLLYSDHPSSMYAIVREVAVPFGSLNCAKQICMLNASARKLDSAPAFTSKRNLVTEGKMAENIYRYFGLQPHWNR